jgi:DNA repair exonuclease SbcCD ATPase subunit
MTIDELLSGTDRLVGRYEILRDGVQNLEVQILTSEAEVETLTQVTAALDALLAQVSEASINEIEQLVTFGLKSVFDDQALALRLMVETKRGAQSMTPRLMSGGVEAPILDAFGGGPATLVAFLLRLLVCQRLKLAPILLLDEPFSFVSAEYTDNLASLLQELARANKIAIVMVTHEQRFLSYADRGYEAKETATGTTFERVTQ